jgi:hypothetical protein
MIYMSGAKNRIILVNKENKMANKKLLEAAAFILEGAKRELQITNLNKALFYFDLKCLLETGKIATDQDYVALAKGPVVDQYKRELIDELEANNIASQYNDDEFNKPIIVNDEFSPQQETLTDQQVEIAKEIGCWAKDHTAKYLSNFSHENYGWKNSIKYGEGTKINMIIAMQQLGDEDPWMKEEFSESEIKTIKSSLESDELIEW